MACRQGWRLALKNEDILFLSAMRMKALSYHKKWGVLATPLSGVLKRQSVLYAVENNQVIDIAQAVIVIGEQAGEHPLITIERHVVEQHRIDQEVDVIRTAMR